MNKILDNPEEYFDSLSREEFKNLLDEFGFEYEEIKKQQALLEKIFKKFESLDKSTHKKKNKKVKNWERTKFYQR